MYLITSLPFKGVPISRTKFSTFGVTCLVYLHHVFYSSPFYVDMWGNDLYIQEISKAKL